jgi:hypothetical protein
MALPIRLILMPLLQRWDGADLSLRLLVAPQTDPTAAPSPGLTPFVATAFEVELRFDADPMTLPGAAAPTATVEAALPVPPDAAALAAALNAEFSIDASVGPIDGRIGAPRIKKFAPASYRLATGYGGGNPDLLIDDSYHCAIKAPPPPGISLKAEPPVMSWGKVLAQALRQPALAEALGLVRPLVVTPPAELVKAGGWVHVTLKVGSPWSGLLGTPGAVRSFAARVPPLDDSRPLFTPVLFPVTATPVPGVEWDALFREAIGYDDGFAKAVYLRQPPQADPIAEEAGERPAEDRGVQIGWDDEQVLTGLNRQMDAAADAPMGVLGYRVDVREAGVGDWESLQRVKIGVALGSQAFEDEIDWRVEVAPNRLLGDAENRSWLASYMTAWNGRSLVGLDSLTAALRGVDPPTGPVQGLPPATDLRYGRSYEFRVRFVDLAGGGPDIDEDPRNGGPQPVAGIDMRRHVRPTGVSVSPRLPLDADPANPPDSIEVSRPLLGFPACLFAGGGEAALTADIPTAQAAARAPGLPDPDVDRLEIAVEVATPEPGAESRYRRVSTVTRAYPASGPLTLDFSWTDVADVADLPEAATGPVALPTARNVRLGLTPIAADKPDYYAGDDVRRGETRLIRLRAPSTDERDLLAQGRGTLIEAFFLQPTLPGSLALAAAQTAAGRGAEMPEDPLGRLAAALDLDRTGTAVRARSGQRLIFGASPLLRHVVGPDGASLTFSTANEITRLWLVAVVLRLRRDWSWDGLDHLRVLRDGAEVGRIEGRTSAGLEAAGDSARDASTLVFLDAIDPKPATGAFPRPIEAEYSVEPVFRTAPAHKDAPLTAAITVPVTTPPAQTPRLVSAGLALSPYRRDPAYSDTEERRKAVWLEFERPPDDPADRYYARVLASAPDPALTDETEGLPDPGDLPLPIDPEPIRQIVPGQGDDRAGQTTMQLLLPTTSPVHFLLPLPPGISEGDPELLGFFVYEFRVGHFDLWSTAQGFPGRAQRVAGIQHAPPPLACAVTRSKARLTVSAAFADPVRDGRSLRRSPPVTELWALLYARVHQADDAERRNLLLGSRRLDPPRRGRVLKGRGDPATAAGGGRAEWSSAEITASLELLTLGPDAPLSCLVVETLPGESPFADPVGRDLGYERFLRTSPLTSVPLIC